MSNFWPKGIEISDTQSPMQILETAQEEWVNNSNGVMTLRLQGTKSESGNDMIIVHAKHVPSNRTITLFSVIYRPNTPYPATIQPKEDELPNYLKKSYYPNTFSERQSRLKEEMRKVSIIETSKLAEVYREEQKVNNIWVSDDPSEFREKLEKVFNLGIVKADILNLLSTVQGVTGNKTDEPAEEFTREDEE
jgi:hypothetical protein